MSAPAKDETVNSPDYLVTPKRKEGQERPNRYLLIILAFVVLVGGLFLIGDAHDRTIEDQKAVAKEAEIGRVTSVAVPSVKKPLGPDVEYQPAQSNTIYVQGQPQVGAQEPEWIKRQREAQMQAYRAALTSGIEMTIPNPRRQDTPQQSSVPMPPVNGTVPPPPPYRGPEGEGGVDPAEQAQQRAFLAAIDPNASTYLKHAKNPPISPYEIKAGSVIPGVMISGINSELPGQCLGQVKQDVYDSATGLHLLIPAGAKLVCTYDSAINAGQSSIFVAWTRIIYPDSSSLTLDSMPGANQSGLAGFSDQVDNHYVRTFGQAFLLSLFSAGIQLSQPRGAVQGTYNAQQIGAAAIGQQLGQLGMQIARRNLYMQPTLVIRPGFEFTIAVNKDMVIPPWQGHPMQQNNRSSRENS